jgi:acetate kinase
VTGVAATDVNAPKAPSRVLVVNSGSSSIKYRLVDPAAGTAPASGLVERVGADGSRLIHRHGDREVRRDPPVPDHESGFRAIAAAFADAGPALDDARLVGVGHRVVHGGQRFREPVVVDDAVMAAIRDLEPLAPLQNPANLAGIEAARRLRPDLPQVAVFDTAFHRTIPPHAATYGLPTDLAARHGVRRYGFHGTSVEYVTREAARLLGRAAGAVDLVVLHLGNGASATAVSAGRSVDTSMGLSPLEGLLMGTRSGDIDPAAVFHLHREAGLTYEDIEQTLNHESGLMGLAGANDMREVLQRAAAGDEPARLAVAVYCYRIKKYVGAYYAALGRLDAVVFTAGVGENAAAVRATALAGLDRLGIMVDPARNAAPTAFGGTISPDGAEVAVLVVPTNEELEIARQTLAVVQRHNAS